MNTTHDPITNAILVTAGWCNRSTVIKTAAVIGGISLAGLMVGAPGAATAESVPVPVNCSATVPVQEGQSLYRIGVINNMTVEQVIAMNPQLPDPDLIHPGQTICLALNGEHHSTGPDSIDIGTALALRADGSPFEDHSGAWIPATTNGDHQPNESVRGVAWEAFGDLGVDAFVEALQIARCESSYSPFAHRTDSDPGLLSGDLSIWQINAGVWTEPLKAAGIIDSRQDLFNERTNARAARFIYDQTGDFSAWYMSTGCHDHA